MIKVLEGEYLKSENRLLSEAKKLNIFPHTPRICTGINIEKFDTVQSDRIYRKIETYFQLYNIEHIIYRNNYRIFFLISSKKEAPLKQLNKHINTFVQDANIGFNGADICFCVSQVYEYLADLPYAFDEVRYLLEKDDILQTTVCYYEDFILANILDDVRAQNSTSRAGKVFLDKLNVLDDDEKADMYGTLKHLSENDFNITQTAQTMFLHRNTLYKRMQKLEKLLNISFESPDNKLMIRLIVKISEG